MYMYVYIFVVLLYLVDERELRSGFRSIQGSGAFRVQPLKLRILVWMVERDVEGLGCIVFSMKCL